jgi:hypothetical protein
LKVFQDAIIVADSPQQLIEGRRPLPSLEVFLDCVQLFDREDVASQKITFKNSRHWNFQVGFFSRNPQQSRGFGLLSRGQP